VSEKLDPGLAGKILRRMGETGQPPERGALKVNVGTEEFLDVLRNEYLIPIRDARANSTFKLVQAPFGGGKTHFLHCLREMAWKEGFATALVGVSPKECPFDQLAQVYQKVAQTLEAPPPSDEVECDHGIGDVLRAEVRKRQDAFGADEVQDWLEGELGQARVDNHAFRRAVLLFMEAALEGRREREALLESYLRGESVSRKELQPLAIRDVLEERNAFGFLKSLIQVFNVLGMPGVVLLFDEIDRVMSLTVRKKRTIADNMREMIDCCGQSTLPGLVFVYAVPPEFLTNLVPEYPALEQRLKGVQRFSTLSPMNPVIDLDHLPVGSDEILKRIGHRLLEIFQAAHEGTLNADLQKGNVDVLAAVMAESQLESGARRTFVKSAVQLFHAQARGGENKMTVEAARALVEGGREAPPGFEGEEVFG